MKGDGLSVEMRSIDGIRFRFGPSTTAANSNDRRSHPHLKPFLYNKPYDEVHWLRLLNALPACGLVRGDMLLSGNQHGTVCISRGQSSETPAEVMITSRTASPTRTALPFQNFLILSAAGFEVMLGPIHSLAARVPDSEFTRPTLSRMQLRCLSL
ncbi:hypothetical protein CALVIDRAFT_258065 [Calocera viscosa TUFC12733]|uniref:Uncharacterized protein n=1 Tax=Calocera viscosa (strain TUFC12733) TaxID=1330018 RepID=A0A167JBD0_CALVF|nr:hypothetical protein CALVIDRAFT_258065 [Calocera viscosa TUFC12733]